MVMYPPVTSGPGALSSRIAVSSNDGVSRLSAKIAPPPAASSTDKKTATRPLLERVNLLGVPEEVEGNRHGGALEDKRFERRLQDEVDQRGSSDDGCDRQDRSLVRLHALLTGRLAGTETLIEQAYECGRESIPWNARIARLRQRVVLFTLTGADARLEPELRAAAAQELLYPSLQAALAGLYADMQDAARCRAAFEPMTAKAIPFDELWVLTMGLLGHACATVGDSDRAALLYERLEPFAHHQQVAPTEASLGSAARPLGELAATLGDVDLAARWFEQAADTDERAGALPWAAHARRQHGEMLLAAAHTSSRARRDDLPRTRNVGVGAALHAGRRPGLTNADYVQGEVAAQVPRDHMREVLDRFVW